MLVNIHIVRGANPAYTKIINMKSSSFRNEHCSRKTTAILFIYLFTDSSILPIFFRFTILLISFSIEATEDNFEQQVRNFLKFLTLYFVGL